MPLVGDIEVGDHVKVAHKGRKAEGLVTAIDRARREITFEPTNPRFTWRTIPTKEVTEVRSSRWSPANAVFR